VISVDTKKKELVGDFKNAGREWQLRGEPEPVRVHDFEIREPDKGKVASYGIYDLGRNVGWVSMGVDHDTAAFAVESIRRWAPYGDGGDRLQRRIPLHRSGGCARPCDRAHHAPVFRLALNLRRIAGVAAEARGIRCPTKSRDCQTGQKSFHQIVSACAIVVHAPERSSRLF